MRGLDALRGLGQPEQDRDVADELLDVAKSMVAKKPTPEPVLIEEPEEEALEVGVLVAKVSDRSDLDAIGLLLGAGARLQGKRLVLDLGAAGTVAYTPQQAEYAAKTERGELTARVDDVYDVVVRLGLDSLSFDTASLAPLPDPEDA